jgi:hypothetical protein
VEAAKSAWSGSTSFVGIVFGEIGYGLGLAQGSDPWMSMDSDGHIQFENLPSWYMPSAMTFGHVIVYGKGNGPNTLTNHQRALTKDHEHAHIPQGDVLGPFYLPAHAFFGISALLTQGDWHGSNNLLEVGPQKAEPEPWWW